MIKDVAGAVRRSINRLIVNTDKRVVAEAAAIDLDPVRPGGDGGAIGEHGVFRPHVVVPAMRDVARHWQIIQRDAAARSGPDDCAGIIESALGGGDHELV